MAACFFYSLCEQIVTSLRQKSRDPMYKVLITHHPPSPSTFLTPSSLCPLQQEQLLLSVLPRYIAMELKTEVIKRLTKPKSDEKKESSFLQPQRRPDFHSLYVRQHKDVR